jgi:translation elongation factor EF-Ts
MEERKLIQEMRKQTGLPILQCRSYLQRTNWNLEEAIKLARKEARNFLIW